MSEPVKIDRMYINDFEIYSNIAVIGKKMSGKTSLASWLMYYTQKKHKLAVIFSKTCEMTHVFDGPVNQLLQNKQYSSKIMKQIQNMQICSTEINEEREKHNKRKKRDGIMIIIDDLSADAKTKENNWTKDTNFLEFMFDGRHYKITFILCVHDPMIIPSMARENLDYIVIAQNLTNAAFEKFYKHYWQDTFDDKITLKQTMEKCTQEYKMMVINRKKMLNTKINSISDIVSYIDVQNPKKIPKYRFGSKSINKILDKIYDKDWQRKARKSAMGKLMNKTEDIILQ
jgi:hypothetical protein